MITTSPEPAGAGTLCHHLTLTKIKVGDWTGYRCANCPQRFTATPETMAAIFPPTDINT